jgi:hypothetical protein
VLGGEDVNNWSDYLIELHREKDLAYGDAWCRRGEAAGIFTNIARKYDRWIRIRAIPQGPSSVEPLDDTLADLLIYCVKYLLWLLERYPDTAERMPAEFHDAVVVGTSDVASVLAVVTGLPLIRDSVDVLTRSFDELESTFLADGVSEEIKLSRMNAAWSIARAAWVELHAMNIPGDRVNNSMASNTPGTSAIATTEDLFQQLLPLFSAAPRRILLLGRTQVSFELRARLQQIGLGDWVLGIVDPQAAPDEGLGVLEWSKATLEKADLVVITSDEDKVGLLRSFEQTRASSSAFPDVLLSGMGHMDFRDSLYDELNAPALVPSYATGYPFTRVHMYQHLRAAAASGLTGAIVEFGAFKGGTTAWLARVVRHLEMNVRILAFDSWDGFPPKRSVLDLYSHPRCVFSDLPSVRNYLEPLGVEIVPGDITDTAPLALKDVPVLLAFVDTDNYSPAVSALRAVADNVVPGGAIVFDHYTTTVDYLYTLGERMAADEVLQEGSFFHVEGTGVFVKLPQGT